MPKVTKFERLPIDSLVIDRFQARKSNTGERLEELAENIEKWGLLQPIVVCRSERDGTKWEIICGQRRFLAHKKILRRETIDAGIVEGQVSIEEGLALSTSENVVRLDMTRKDLIDVCAELFKRYGTIKDVVSETGLPYPCVRKYIRYDGLPAHLQAKVNDDKVSVDLAMKIQDASVVAGAYDESRAEDLLSILKTVDNPIQRKILELRKRHPDVDLEKIRQKAEQPDKSLKLSFTVGETLAVPLRSYARDQEMEEKDAVIEFIQDSLSRGGYLGSDD